MKIGAHMSISGDLYKCVNRGNEVGCEVVQIFTKSNRRWEAKEIEQQDRAQLLEVEEEQGIDVLMVHMSYLINLAKKDQDAWEKSYHAFVEELERAEYLEIPLICFHPGSHLGNGVEFGIERIAKGVQKALDESDTTDVRVLIENMAGEGTSIGAEFSHLRDLLGEIDRPERTGVCLDTAHLHASGYSLCGPSYEETMNEFDTVVGLDQVFGWHLNDTEKELGSEVDRHHHIGKGNIGEKPFQKLVRDDRFSDLPGFLETPKENDWDEKNISLLKKLRNGD